MLMQQMPPKYCIKIVISNELHKYWNVFFMWKCNNFKGFQTPFKWRLKAFLYRACAIIFSHFVLYPDYRISFFIPLAFRFADYRVKAVFISGIFLTNWEVTDIPNVVVGRISALYIFRKKQNIFMAAAVPIVGNFRESTICRQGHWIGIWVIRMQIKTSRTGGLSSVSKTIS